MCFCSYNDACKGRRTSEVVIRGDVISHLPLIITVALTDELSGVIFKLHRINSLEMYKSENHTCSLVLISLP